MKLRREPYQFACFVNECGGIFFKVEVSMRKRRNRLPFLTSINGEIRCQKCGRTQSYLDHVHTSRGWSRKDEAEP